MTEPTRYEINDELRSKSCTVARFHVLPLYAEPGAGTFRHPFAAQSTADLSVLSQYNYVPADQHGAYSPYARAKGSNRTALPIAPQKQEGGWTDFTIESSDCGGVQFSNVKANGGKGGALYKSNAMRVPIVNRSGDCAGFRTTANGMGAMDAAERWRQERRRDLVQALFEQDAILQAEEHLRGRREGGVPVQLHRRQRQAIY